jgi:signal transduction histidine kinase/CheY-like chemotaxis protein
MGDPVSGSSQKRPAAEAAAARLDAALERAREDEERLRLLAAASDALLSSQDAAKVVPAILGLALRLFQADTCAVWRRRAGPGNWKLVAEVNRAGEERFVAAGVLQADVDLPAPADEVLGDSARRGAQDLRIDAGPDAPFCLPLIIDGQPGGALAVYHEEPHAFSEPDIQVGRALANLVAAAMTAAELDEEQRRQIAEGLRAVAARARCLLWYAHVEEDEGGGLTWRLRVADEEAARRFLPVQMLPGHSYGQALSEARIPEDRVLMSFGDEEIRAGRSYHQEFRVRDASGAIRWLAEDVETERIGPGQWYTVGVSVDISERRRLEEALRQRAEELADADRRKDEFLAMLAHELRNPLGAITNSVAVLQHADADEQARKRALDVLARQVQHQSRMVDDLLDVSRITRGLVELRLQPIDLAALVRETVEDYRTQYRGSGVELALRLAEPVIPAVGDPVRLSQVFGNLLSNALKFTPSGERVQVSVDREEGVAVIRVRDSGVGIAPELLPRVFETFTQGDRSLARSQGGLGLGLALVRGLVELHGGSVSAHSEGPGSGAEFVVRLPLRKDEGGRLRDEGGRMRDGTSDASSGVRQPSLAGGDSIPALVPPSSTDLGAAGSPSDLDISPPSRTVLVVEDNPDAAESMRDLLELAGYRVEVARTGPEAVATARRTGPAVVLCDIGLPGMDGYEVAGALRREPRTAGACLIAISGYGQAKDLQRSHDAGFDDHLVKPIVPQQLLELLSTRGR